MQGRELLALYRANLNAAEDIVINVLRLAESQEDGHMRSLVAVALQPLTFLRENVDEAHEALGGYEEDQTQQQAAPERDPLDFFGGR